MGQRFHLKPIALVVFILCTLIVSLSSAAFVYADSLDTMIYQKYDQLKAQGTNLGNQVSGIRTSTDGTGKYLHYQYGSIYCTLSTGAHLVRNGIKHKWDLEGSEIGSLGYPITDDLQGQNGWYQDFQKGSIYWSASTGSVVVKSYIKNKYIALGAEKSFLGYPKADQVLTSYSYSDDNYKLSSTPQYKQDFQGGTIYTSTFGTFFIRNGFKARYDADGGFLKYGHPIGDETTSSNVIGCYQ